MLAAQEVCQEGWPASPPPARVTSKARRTDWPVLVESAAQCTGLGEEGTECDFLGLSAWRLGAGLRKHRRSGGRVGARATGPLSPHLSLGGPGWSRGEQAWQAAKGSIEVRALPDSSCDPRQVMEPRFLEKQNNHSNPVYFSGGSWEEQLRGS